MGSSLHDKRTLFEQDVQAVSQSNGFLSPISFRYLEQLRGKPLEIPFLESLSLNLALPLAGHFGPLILDGLKEFSPQVAKALASHGGILSLNGLKFLDSACANFLKNHEGALFLNGLTDLPKEIASLLSEHRGDLNLNGLLTLEEGAAIALAEHRGALHLDGISLLSDRGAFALSTHEGKLSLKNLVSLSSIHPPHGDGIRSLLKVLSSADPELARTIPPIRQMKLTTQPHESVNLLDQALALNEGPEETLEDPFLPRFGNW